MAEGGADDVVLDGGNDSFLLTLSWAWTPGTQSKDLCIGVGKINSGINSEKASSWSVDASFIVNLLLLFLFSARWSLVIPVVWFSRGDFLFFLSSAHADIASTLARLELRLLLEASSDWFWKEPFSPSKTTSSAPPLATIASIIY